MTQTAIVPGSLSDVAKLAGASIAESFVGADAVIIVDTSGSMDEADSRGGQTRYAVACEELARLQREMPGKLAVIAFSSAVMFCPGGQPYQFHGGTNLEGALKFARVADVPGMRFFVISDGYPDDANRALKEASKFKAPISGVFVGPEGDRQGQEFMRKLASWSGGKYATSAKAIGLADNVTRLLISEGQHE